MYSIWDVYQILLIFFISMFVTHSFHKERNIRQRQFVLIHYCPVFPFYIPWKHQKTYDVFSGNKKEIPDSNGLNVIDPTPFLFSFSGHQTLKGWITQLLTLREKCPYSGFVCILLPISPYSVQMRENTDQKNSEHGHFSRSLSYTFRQFR